MSGEADAAPAPKTSHWRGRRRGNPIPSDEAARQGAISKLAFLMLGREEAIAFLNTEHEGLGGRPLALATASAAGRNDVEAELARMTCREFDVGAHLIGPSDLGGVRDG